MPCFVLPGRNGTHFETLCERRAHRTPVTLVVEHDAEFLVKSLTVVNDPRDALREGDAPLTAASLLFSGVSTL